MKTIVTCREHHFKFHGLRFLKLKVLRIDVNLLLKFFINVLLVIILGICITSGYSKIVLPYKKVDFRILQDKPNKL